MALPEARARQVRRLLAGYGLSRAERVGVVNAIVAFAVHAVTWEAIEAKVTHDTRATKPLWAIVWRTRSAAWMLRYRAILDYALL